MNLEHEGCKTCNKCPSIIRNNPWDFPSVEFSIIPPCVAVVAENKFTLFLSKEEKTLCFDNLVKLLDFLASYSINLESYLALLRIKNAMGKLP